MPKKDSNISMILIAVLVFAIVFLSLNQPAAPPSDGRSGSSSSLFARAGVTSDKGIVIPCSVDGYAWCYETAYVYAGKDAILDPNGKVIGIDKYSASSDARFALSTSQHKSSDKTFQPASLGQAANFYYAPYSFYYTCNGDAVSWNYDSWPTCNEDGCNGNSIPTEGTLSFTRSELESSHPNQANVLVYFTCWDKDTDNGAWSWTWSGLSPTVPVSQMGWCSSDDQCELTEMCNKVTTKCEEKQAQVVNTTIITPVVNTTIPDNNQLKQSTTIFGISIVNSSLIALIVILAIIALYLIFRKRK